MFRSEGDPMKVILDNHLFQAEIIPEIGGGVISLTHSGNGTRLLREPTNMDELRAFPEQFGIPVLFPPNRIADGRFRFEGREYRLPVNEIAMGNHLHGLAVGAPWKLLNADRNTAELQFTFSARNPEYDGFPFAFALNRRIELTGCGLRDSMTVTNQSKWDMPLGLGYHTSFPAPERIRLGADDRQIEIGERYLPTGRLTEWREFDPRGWFDPNGRDAGFHARAGDLKSEDGSSFHGAELLYRSGLLRYVTDRKFSFWYTWNKRGKGDFISLEPVSWMADALNQDAAPEETGVRVLAPGRENVFRCELQFFPLRTLPA